jgi:demethylmenaquinone methyltransferase/2-methoxy-6-polyprenyl-1,4-benzoquinol methylase
MFRKIPQWSEKHIRKAQLDDHINRVEAAFFGFQKVPSDKKTELVHQHFNRIAQKYDLMNTILSFGMHYLWKKMAIDVLNLKPGDRVIDVCGGTGDLAILAHLRVDENGLVVIYDINRAMMEVGKQKVKHRDTKNQIQWVQGDAETISLSDGIFDAAVVGFGIRNVTHMKKAFQEMYRVIKPGGKVVCLEFSKPNNPFFRRLYDFYSFYVMPCLGKLIVGSGQPYACLSESIRLFPLPEELIGILEQVGFSAVSHRKLTNGIAVVYCGTKS